mgnify:CR=1 FL=1
MNTAADWWITEALLKAGDEETLGAELNEVTRVDCSGAVSSVAEGGTATEVVETTGGVVCSVEGAVG